MGYQLVNFVHQPIYRRAHQRQRCLWKRQQETLEALVIKGENTDICACSEGSAWDSLAKQRLIPDNVAAGVLVPQLAFAPRDNNVTLNHYKHLRCRVSNMANHLTLLEMLRLEHCRQQAQFGRWDDR